jgi:hypothetical protein
MLIRLQRIYNLWSIHAIFTWVLYGFGALLYYFYGLTYSSSAQCQFLFFVSQKYHNKQSPNAIKIHGDFLWTKREPRSTGDGPGGGWGSHKPGGAPPRARPPSLWAPWAPPLTWIQRQTFLYILETPERNLESRLPSQSKKYLPTWRVFLWNKRHAKNNNWHWALG